LLPERHLGLVPPQEYPGRDDLRIRLATAVAAGLDFQQVLDIARAAGPFAPPLVPKPSLPDGAGLKIGYVRDAAFSFYYDCNLETLASSGAELVPISAMSSPGLPAGLSALYIGGGFPEVHAPALAANTGFLRSLALAAAGGLPIYAECGGLMLLSRAITWRGKRHAMSDVLPFDSQVSETAQGHGYVELLVDRANPFFAPGTVIRGHEFHYSTPIFEGDPVQTVCAVRRGKGMGEGRDAVVVGNVWAGYTHVHALATPEWAAGMVQAARRFAGTHALQGCANGSA